MSSIYRVNYQLRPHKRDGFIEFIKALLLNPFILHQHLNSNESTPFLRQGYADVMMRLEDLILGHIQNPQQSHLSQLVPSLTNFFSPLPLKEAFLVFDKHTQLSQRRFVPPSFNDIRHILNIAQLMGVSEELKLITFDGDQTLYGDGMDFENDDTLVDHIVNLLRRGLYIAVVTAAGYPNDPEKYEKRLSGLLNGFRRYQLEDEVMNRFYVLGGECNFLFQCSTGARLQSIPQELYFTDAMKSWNPDLVKAMLDIATETFTERVSSLGLNATVMRKQRAVGIVPNSATAEMPRELLDEVVMAAQYNVTRANIDVPFCAFNGGRDAWVDVGNKLLGVQVLQNHLTIAAGETMHVGDQFLSTGNDIATRNACCTLWVTNPDETRNALKTLLDEMAKK